MAKRLLNPTAVRETKPGDKEIIVWDDRIAGFGLRVTPKGAKTYIFKHRVGRGAGAVVRKPTIGVADGKGADVKALNETARATALEWHAVLKAGGDPARARKEHDIAPDVSALCDIYMERHGSTKRSASEDQRRIDKTVKPKLGKLKARDVTQMDIEDLHRSYRDRPYEGNRVLGLLSKMFNLAEEWGYVDKNPATRVKKYPEQRRRRYMTKDEDVRFRAALRTYLEVPDQNRIDAVDIIAMLSLTGARCGEVLSATWDQFDLDSGLWTTPAAYTKTAREYRRPISDEVVQLLRTRARSGKFIFPGPGRTGHRVNIKGAWQKIRKLASIEDLRVHDLRHTFASLLVSEGVPLSIIGALLGHTQIQTTMGYAHLLDEPLREAAGRIGTKLGGFGNQRPAPTRVDPTGTDA
jgi:integrase